MTHVATLQRLRTSTDKESVVMEKAMHCLDHYISNTEPTTKDHPVNAKMIEILNGKDDTQYYGKIIDAFIVSDPGTIENDILGELFKIFVPIIFGR